MKSITFEYEDKERQKKIKRETNRKHKVYDLQVKTGKSKKQEYWITARNIWGDDHFLPKRAIDYIIETFATRRPYLPEARSWWKDINSDSRIRSHIVGEG